MLMIGLPCGEEQGNGLSCGESTRLIVLAPSDDRNQAPIPMWVPDAATPELELRSAQFLSECLGEANLHEAPRLAGRTVRLSGLGGECESAAPLASGLDGECVSTAPVEREVRRGVPPCGVAPPVGVAPPDGVTPP